MSNSQYELVSLLNERKLVEEVRRVNDNVVTAKIDTSYNVRFGIPEVRNWYVDNVTVYTDQTEITFKHVA